MSDKEARARAREQERQRREDLQRQELGLQEYAWEKPKGKYRRPKPPRTWDLN